MSISLREVSLIKIYLHAVWAVKYRDAVLQPEMKPLVVDTIHSLLAARGHRPIVTNFEPDHLHALFRWSAKEPLPTTMQAVKGASSKSLNDVYFAGEAPFRWQGGYAAFSVCPTHVQSKAQYVRDQQLIHARRAFEREYAELLAEHPPAGLDDTRTYWNWVPLEDR